MCRDESSEFVLAVAASFACKLLILGNEDKSTSEVEELEVKDDLIARRVPGEPGIPDENVLVRLLFWLRFHRLLPRRGIFRFGVSRPLLAIRIL